MTDPTESWGYAPRVQNPLDRRTFQPTSQTQQWQVDLLVDLGYLPNPMTNDWDIAMNGVHVVGNRVVVTEVVVDAAGGALFTVEGHPQERESWHNLPDGWPR